MERGKSYFQKFSNKFKFLLPCVCVCLCARTQVRACVHMRTQVWIHELLTCAYVSVCDAGANIHEFLNKFKFPFPFVCVRAHARLYAHAGACVCVSPCAHVGADTCMYVEEVVPESSLFHPCIQFDEILVKLRSRKWVYYC